MWDVERSLVAAYKGSRKNCKSGPVQPLRELSWTKQ
jgi:hypothetical protein